MTIIQTTPRVERKLQRLQALEEELVEEALEECEAITPEHLGELLHNATMDLPQRGLYSDTYVQDCRERQSYARRIIRELPNGVRLLQTAVDLRQLIRYL